VLDLWTDLLGCLDLHLEHERSEAENVTVFEGVSQQSDYHRVFGGQLLGQLIQAASLACPDKTVKSLHAVVRTRRTGPGSAAALSKRHRPMTQKRSHIAQNEQFGESYSR
jgi:acyl-CoA thioesterase-2